MSIPLSNCLVYKAILGDDDALKRLFHVFGYNGDFGSMTTFPCKCNPPCQVPTLEQAEAFVKRLEEIERTKMIQLSNPTPCCAAKVLVECSGVYKCPCGETKYGYRKESNVHMRPVRPRGEQPGGGTSTTGMARAGVRPSDSGARVVYQTRLPRVQPKGGDGTAQAAQGGAAAQSAAARATASSANGPDKPVHQGDVEGDADHQATGSSPTARNKDLLRFLIKLDASDRVSVSDWECEFIESHVSKAYVDFSPKQVAAIERMIEKYGKRIGW